MYASDFNVPQNRRRVIIFGVRRDLQIRPFEPNPLYDISSRPTVKSVLQDQKEIDESYYLSKKAIDGIMLKKARMKKEKKGFGAQYLDLNKPSYTIPARYWKDGYDALVKYSDTSIRRLTIKELSRIQTFPDKYVFHGSKKDQIMQIGNAVACNFAYNMGLHITEILNQKRDRKLSKNRLYDDEICSDNETPVNKIPIKKRIPQKKIAVSSDESSDEHDDN